MATIPTRPIDSRFALPQAVADKISAVVRRARGLRLLAGAILALAGGLLVLLAAIGIDWLFVLFEPAHRERITSTAWIVAGLLGSASLAVAVLKGISRRDAAREIDRQVPELEERWMSVADFAASGLPVEMRGSEAMRRRVAEEAERLEGMVEPAQIRTGREMKVAGVCLAVMLSLWVFLFAIDPAQMSVLVRRFVSPHAPISLTELKAESGDLIQPRGSSVKLEALVQGRVRPEAELTIRQADGSEERRPLKLAKGETPRFVFPLKKIDESFSYRFRSGDGQTAWHTVTVAERPALKEISFRIVPPVYSKLPEFQQNGFPKSARALQGSRLILQLASSIPLKSLVLQGENKATVLLEPSDAGTYRWEMELEESWAFRPIQESVEGLKNELPPRCEIVVYRDQAPVVAVAAPTPEVAVRPDDTLTIAFDAKDDLGISRAELVVFSGPSDEELKTIPIPLGEQAGEKTVHAQIDLDLKEFELKHGAQLTYAIRVYDTKNTQTMQQPSDGGDASDAETKPHDLAGADSKPSTETPDESTPQDSKPADLAQSKSAPSETSDANPAQANSASAASETQADENSKQSLRIARQDPPRDSREEEQEESEPSKPQPGGGNTWKPNVAGNSPPKKPGGEVAGAPRPEFHMPKRMLDTPAGQCSSCARRRITIDEWAGSYASQALEKLQLEIDPVLSALKQALTEARDTLRPVADRARKETQWEVGDARQVRAADGHLNAADGHVKTLTAKSDGTPYAFIGLQLQDILQLHIQPARHHLSDVTLFDGASSPGDLTASIVHIERALELLDRLTRQYEAAALNQKLADTMTQIKKMHQIFLEGTFAMLKSQKPNLNPKDRSFMELELTDEFLERLQKLLKKKLDIQAELAKLLANDPRLLQRFMARSRLEATTLRDQLTLLNRSQQQLRDEIKAGLPPENMPEAKLELRNRVPHRTAEATRIAQEAATMLDNFIVWTPRGLDPDARELAAVKAKLVEIVAIASEWSAGAGDENVSPALDAAERLYNELRNFKEKVPAVLEFVDHPKLPTHLAYRVQEADKLITDVSGWIRKEKVFEAGDQHLAAEVDQHRITVDTMALTRKLTSLKAQCQGINAALGAAAESFLETMEEDLIPELEQAQLTLGENHVRQAIVHQKEAIDHFTRAEQELDEVMDGIIKHLDSLPYNKRPELAEDAQPESLDELLAMLEDEARAAEGLGIPCRPSNLLIEKDWFSPGSPSGAGGGGQAGLGTGSGGARRMNARSQLQQAKEAGALADKLRRQAELAAQKLMRGSSVDEEGGAAIPRKQERRWNTLGSKLDEHLRQGRGNLPPEQYRRAIELYFESLAERRDSSALPPE